MSLLEVQCRATLQRNLGALNRHAALNNLVLMLTVQAEIQLCTTIFAGDIGRTARFLSSTASMVGLFEFCVNPSIGKLSDRFGRKMFLLMGCSWAVVGNTLVALGPYNLPLVTVNRCLTWSLITLSGSVTGGAAVADCSEAGGELAINLSRFFSMFGIGVVVGPLVGGLILGAGSPRWVYAARAVVAGCELIHDCVMIREPLGLRERYVRPDMSFVETRGHSHETPRSLNDGRLRIRSDRRCIVGQTIEVATCETSSEDSTSCQPFWILQGISATHSRYVSRCYVVHSNDRGEEHH